MSISSHPDGPGEGKTCLTEAEKERIRADLEAELTRELAACFDRPHEEIRAKMDAIMDARGHAWPRPKAGPSF